MAALVPALAKELQHEIEGYEWHPRRLPVQPGGRERTGPVDPGQWQDVILLAEAKKVDVSTMLKRCIDFGFRTLDPHGKMRAEARAARQQARKRA